MKIKIMALCLICALLFSACGTPMTPVETTNVPTSQPAESVEATTQSTEATTQPTETTTQPTESETQPTEAVTQPTESETQPTTPSTEATTPATEPTTDATEPTQSGNSYATSFEAYQAMSPAEQQAFFESFGNYEAFIAWYIAAEAAYKESQDRNEVSGDGNIDIGDLVGGGNG